MKEILFRAHNIKGEYRNCEICSEKFWAYRYKIKQGRGRFCSHKCSSAYQVGKRNSIGSEFKKGHIPAPREIATGEKHSNWKGDAVGYHALHGWVKRWKGNPVKCERCGKDFGRLEWANIDRKYKRKLDDFISLCKSCHTKHDTQLIKITNENNRFFSNRKRRG